MDIWQIVVLALVQGLTEFLPISSSAHLILVPHLFGWTDQGLAFDVAVHAGTLTAVIAYFRTELLRLAQAWAQSLVSGRHSADSHLCWGVMLGTIPVGVAALVFGTAVETTLRAPLVIATTTIGFGLLLGWADMRGRRERDEHSLTWKDIALIGCAQALALIPGTSRSGITITAGLAVGLTREAAARFSFLLAIPVIALAGGSKVIDLARADVPVHWDTLVAGALIAGLSAYLCIRAFFALLTRVGMLPFVIYRLILGAVIIVTSTTAI